MEKSKKKDFDFITILLRKLSVYSASFLNKMSINPNQVTIFRFIFFGVGGAYCFYIGTHVFNIIGVAALLLNYYFDLVDGDLARNYNKKSKLGKFLEELLDPILLCIVIFSIALNLFTNDNIYKYFGLVCLFGQIFSFKMSQYFQYNYNINCVEGSDLLESNLKGKRLDAFSFFIQELVTPKNLLISLFCNFRYYLITGALLGIMPLTISLYAVAINIRWIVLSVFLIILNSNFNIKEKIILINELENIENRKGNE